MLHNASQLQQSSTILGGAGIGKRGGSWNNNPTNCRAANRNYKSTDNCNNNVGFRLVCAVFPALFYCQNWPMGIVRAYPEESRPVPVMGVTLSENKTGSDSLVGDSRTVIRSTTLQPFQIGKDTSY